MAQLLCTHGVSMGDFFVRLWTAVGGSCRSHPEDAPQAVSRKRAAHAEGTIVAGRAVAHDVVRDVSVRSSHVACLPGQQHGIEAGRRAHPDRRKLEAVGRDDTGTRQDDDAPAVCVEQSSSSVILRASQLSATTRKRPNYTLTHKASNANRAPRLLIGHLRQGHQRASATGGQSDAPKLPRPPWTFFTFSIGNPEFFIAAIGTDRERLR